MITYPVFLIAPMSRIGTLIGSALASSCSNLIASVDDERSSKKIHGAVRWSSKEFIENAKKYPTAIAIDFSTSHKGHAWAQNLCKENNINLWHWSFAIASIYNILSDNEIKNFTSKTRDSRAPSLLHPETTLLRREILSLPDTVFKE